MQESNKFFGFGPVVAVLTAGFVLAQINSGAAQPYYYQPAPDYYHNDTVGGTFLGGAMGAITGAIIGGRHHAGQDALIGAGVGAVTGNLLGQSKDRTDERRAAAGAAAVGQMNQQAAAMAVTDNDLVQMTRAGISEDVIISTMRSRGARVDLSPQSLISLRQQGVSDRVVIAAQQMRWQRVCSRRAGIWTHHRQRSAASANRHCCTRVSTVLLLSAAILLRLLRPFLPSAHGGPRRILERITFICSDKNR